MKKTIKSAIAVTLFVSALTAAIMASPNMLFRINNNTSFDIGTVTVYNDDGTPTTIDVPGPGSFSASIHDGISAAVINNQSIPKNGKASDITLASGIVVQAKFGVNQIVVTDQTVIYSPTKPHSK
jgi:hypothetical protein